MGDQNKRVFRAKTAGRELLIYSQHYCTHCRKYFNAAMTDLAAPGSHYTKRVVDTAVRLVIEDGLPYRTASWSLWRDHRVFVPYATIQNWVEDGGEKAERRIPTDYYPGKEVPHAAAY